MMGELPASPEEMASTTVEVLSELSKIFVEIGRAALAVQRPDMEALAIESREQVLNLATRWLQLVELQRGLRGDRL